MNFSTFGPYRLEELSQKGVEALFERAEEDKSGIAHAIGVYVLATRNSSGALLPQYVGKTINGFRPRFRQHIDKCRFDKLLSSTHSLEVFLIARVTPKGRLRTSTDGLRRNKRMKSINIVEFELIGACLARNPELLNLQESTFHKWLIVPGFIQSCPEDYDDAAAQLAGMLKKT